MRIQYASDLHLEFDDNEEYLRHNPLQVSGEILILAGDIIPFVNYHDADWFFQWCSDNYRATYWVMGNHDYYGGDAGSISTSICISKRVFVVNNMNVFNHELELIFTPLWSKISPANAMKIERSISDFRLIKYNGKRFTSDHFNKCHRQCLDFLKTEIAKPSDKKKVVVTHYVPTFMNYPEKYKGDVINEAFATELFGLIEGADVKAWIYGHHHCNVPDFKIGNTEMLTNQLGYINYGDNVGFMNDKMIEV